MEASYSKICCKSQEIVTGSQTTTIFWRWLPSKIVVIFFVGISVKKSSWNWDFDYSGYSYNDAIDANHPNHTIYNATDTTIDSNPDANVYHNRKHRNKLQTDRRPRRYHRRPRNERNVYLAPWIHQPINLFGIGSTLRKP